MRGLCFYTTEYLGDYVSRLLSRRVYCAWLSILLSTSKVLIYLSVTEFMTSVVSETTCELLKYVITKAAVMILVVFIYVVRGVFPPP